MTDGSGFKVSIYANKMASIRFRGSLEPDMIKRAADECITRECYIIAVDLSDVSHSQSHTISALIALRLQMEMKGGRVVIANVPKSIKIIFDMMGLEKQFRFYDNLESALQALSDGWTTTRRVTL